jgi:phosphoglycolate phosphatase-like HAD superfamily hydrolase
MDAEMDDAARHPWCRDSRVTPLCDHQAVKSRLPAALILDVDNTLFDWMSVWNAAFSALLDTVANTAEVRHALTSRLRALHQRHGSTEYPFVLAELSSIDDGQPLMAFPPEQLREAAARYRAAAEAALTTYPLVRETLTWFGTRGTAIVAVSDTRVDVTGPRMRQLGLDGLVDMLYAPESWEPRSMDPDLVLWPYGLAPLEVTIARPLAGHVKARPALLRVLADLDVLADEAVYVGNRLDEHEPCLLIIDSLAELRARYGDDARADVRGERRAKGAARGEGPPSPPVTR